MEPMRFLKWEGLDGIKNYIISHTGCKPYSGAGINTRIANKTTLLRSVDNTYYYKDDMSDINNPKYTLFGQIGCQDINEKRFNEPLLNKNKTHHIYLYSVRKNGKKNEYLWYGKYEIDGKKRILHQDKNNNLRTIIVLSLKRL